MTPATLFDTRPVTLRQRVHATLEANPQGLTDWEITVALGLSERRKPSVAKRRQECEAVPALDDFFGACMTRPSPDGVPCTVWTLGGVS